MAQRALGLEAGLGELAVDHLEDDRVVAGADLALPPGQEVGVGDAAVRRGQADLQALVVAAGLVHVHQAERRVVDGVELERGGVMVDTVPDHLVDRPGGDALQDGLVLHELEAPLVEGATALDERVQVATHLGLEARHRERPVGQHEGRGLQGVGLDELVQVVLHLLAGLVVVDREGLRLVRQDAPVGLGHGDQDSVAVHAKALQVFRRDLHWL